MKVQYLQIILDVKEIFLHEANIDCGQLSIKNPNSELFALGKGKERGWETLNI